MTRLAFTLLLTWVSLCRSALAWEADKDVRLHRELSERHFNGVVLVVEGERIVFKEAFGLRNFDAKEPADVGTPHEVGSVSKPFAATAILLLEERGDLSLSDPLTKYFPKLPYAEVTRERMLSHTSGLYDVCCQPSDQHRGRRVRRASHGRLRHRVERHLICSFRRS